MVGGTSGSSPRFPSAGYLRDETVRLTRDVKRKNAQAPVVLLTALSVITPLLDDPCSNRGHRCSQRFKSQRIIENTNSECRDVSSGKGGALSLGHWMVTKQLCEVPLRSSNRV